MMEAEQTVTLINNFENNWAKSKKLMNQFDMQMIDCDTTAQTINTCYLIIAKLIGNKSFDVEKMDQKIG